jgi:hypothetical protein
MLTSLCTLTPDQWRFVHQFEPAGITANCPDGYYRAGLYEGKDVLWLIQKNGGCTYRYWAYSDVFRLSIKLSAMRDEFEIAQKARDQAVRLRQHAEELLNEADRLERLANETLNGVLLADQIQPVLAQTG